MGPVGGLAAPGAQAGEEEESLGVAGDTIETPRNALTQRHADTRDRFRNNAPMPCF